MKHVLVTGGAAGIGLAIARAFVESGARVVLCDVNEEALEAARQALPDAIAVSCDVSQVAQIDALFETLSDQFGGLDVLVNNVGVGGPTSPAADLPSEQWQQVLDINLTGTFEVTKRAIPLLKASRGTIIVMSSAAGRFGYPNRLPYAVTKWGLIGLTKTLSMELGGDGISVNAILPGAVSGDRFDRVIAGRAALSGRSLEAETGIGLAAQSVKRVTSPDHVAELALFLTTDAGRMMSGQILPIDGDQQHG